MSGLGNGQDGHPSPFLPLLAEVAKMRKSNLNATIEDVDDIISLIESTREQVAGRKTHPAPHDEPG
jgi:hypothetical protein